MPSDLRRLANWLRGLEIKEAVMESTAQYWRPVWLEMEPHMLLHLARHSPTVLREDGNMTSGIPRLCVGK
jgi:hypothetical protein